MSKQFRLTEKSQVTVPKDVREALGVGPGDAVTYDIDGNSVRIRKGDAAAGTEETRIADFRARLERARALAKPLKLGMSTDEYMALIREPLPPYDE